MPQGVGFGVRGLGVQGLSLRFLVRPSAGLNSDFGLLRFGPNLVEVWISEWGRRDSLQPKTLRQDILNMSPAPGNGSPILKADSLIAVSLSRA